MQFLSPSEIDPDRLPEVIKSEAIAILQNNKPALLLLPTGNLMKDFGPAEIKQVLTYAPHLKKISQLTNQTAMGSKVETRFVDIKQLNIEQVRNISRDILTIILQGENLSIIAIPAGEAEDIGWVESRYKDVDFYAPYLQEHIELQTLPEIDPGFIESSLALAGIAIALSTFLLQFSSDLISNVFKVTLAYLLAVVALFSSISGLWFLSHHSFPGSSLSNPKVIWKMIGRYDLGPFWFKAIALLLLLVLSIVLFCVVVVYTIENGQVL